jgi:ABC-type Fe3+-hydroxamate transport system substrate-binding protein
MQILRKLMLVSVMVLAAITAFAQQKQYRVVTTTSWTAAFAMAAGVTDIVVLAPSELRHPAEYELKPSDIMALAGADLIISTGFESMAKKLADAAGTRHIPVMQIDADYSLATMKKSILTIAAATGTTTKAQENVIALESFIESWKEELHRSGLLGASVLVHVFQKPLMDELGFSVQGVFGPAPLEASQIVKLSAVKATLIVDNWHNEAAAPLREALPQVRYASLINFPGPDGTVTLMDVLADNKKRLSSAMQ